MSDDDQTPEQRLSDIAAALLARLDTLRSEFFCTGTSLALLAEHSGDAELGQAAEAARLLAGQCLVERVRDVAAMLPLRGLEYGRDG